MASGHASRINRPNTWLLRPDLRREESPCQRGAKPPREGLNPSTLFEGLESTAIDGQAG
jgi:hypothetical protein